MLNKSGKKYVVVFYLCYNLLLFKLILGQFSGLGVAAINEQQLKEIQRLKSELSEALDNNHANAAAKDAIVQPSWTQDKTDKTESVKVQVNEQNRNEAAALRAEIELAISKDSYATADVTKTQGIKFLEASFVSKEKGKHPLLPTESKKSISLTPEEQLGAVSFSQEDHESNSKLPNIITASLNDDLTFDMRKLQRLEVSKRRTREILVIKYIEEDFAFELGAEVNEWKHIVHAGQEYFIGRRITDLLLVRKISDEYERAMVVEIGQVITFIETYTYWNMEQEQHEDVILVATADKVLWYRANHKTELIELYWEWVVGNIITGLTHFNLDSKNYLTISSNQSFLAEHYALNIYEYKLEAKEFWIAQRLQLEFPCKEVTVLHTGRDVILAIPQNNTAKIFTFNPHEAVLSHIRFQLKKSVAAEGITTIAGFQMGGRTYLALTGYQPQILLYQQGDFISKTFLSSNFGLVELFFPIPVRTYRDDLILLVQHKVDFSTHSLTVVETLIWDGEAFETSIPVPCHLGKDVVYGVGCMLDSHRDEGLKGAALLKRGEEVSVIVPRFKAESGLFRFHTKLLAKNSELMDLQEVFDFLKDWVNEQDNLVAEAKAFLQLPNEELINIEPDSIFIESLKSSEFELNGNVGEIYVNDYKWTAEDSDTDLELLIQNIEDLERSFNAGRPKRNLNVIQQYDLDFDEVTVEDLEVEKVNGQPYFIQNGELNFNGLINFSELDVLETLTNLQKRQLNDEDFILNGDLEVDQINGVNWSDIKNNLVFSTQNNNFETLEVKGEVVVEDLLTISSLNTLNFPDDYLFTNGPVTSTVTAAKHFTNSLLVSSVNTSGLVNGKNPLDAVTLTGPQEWQGMPIFKQLEIAEVLEIHGQTHGRDDKKFVINPTLNESNIIEANCHFNEIIVNGAVVLKGDLDDKPLGPFLRDILLKPENPADEISVPSSKLFNKVSFPLDFQLENKTVNKIPIDEFVTLHTNQTLNTTSLEGYIYFYNLILNGSYDGVKLEDILNKVIFLDQPVDLSSTELVFPEKLEAHSVTIVDTINKHKIKNNLQTLQEDLYIEYAEFESVHAKQAEFSNDILGQGKLNNIELHSFINDRSWHESPIKGNIFLNELILEKGIQTDELQGIKAEYLLDFLNQIVELPDMVLNGQIRVDHITVTGDVQLHKLNGLLFDEEIQLSTIKLQHPNFLSTNLSFRNRLDIRGQLNIVGDFRGNYLPDLIDDIVIRTNNSCINITAPKSFIQPVQVLKNTEIQALNGISMKNIAWKTKHNRFNGSVHLKGNLIVQNVNLHGSINSLTWQNLEDLLYYDKKLQNFVLKNTIEFKTPLDLQDLTVKGDFNNIRNLTDFFANLIYKNNSAMLNGKNTFTGRVSMDQGALIQHLNGHDLFNFFDNIAFVNGPQPIVIKAPIVFKDSIHAKAIQIQKSLTVEYISGCSLADWLNNSLRVDRDENITHLLQFAAGSIDGNSLLVNFINDIDLSRIITLNTPQTFNETVKFSEVVLNGIISSKGLVNNVDLETEFNNTLMTYGQQHIFNPVNIATITVLGNLRIRGLVNGNKNLNEIATLQEDLVFESPLFFQSIYSPQVYLKDLVSGINFHKWFDSSVQYQNPVAQYITGNWSTKFLTIRTGPKQFQYLINGLEPWQYYSHMRLASNKNNEVYKDNELCSLIKQIWRDISKKPVFIKHIDECFNMNFGIEFKNKNETVNKVFHITSNQEYFLVVNLKCESIIYKWLSEEDAFIFKTSFESGPINEIEIIPAANNSKNILFITKFKATENTDCSLKDDKTWRVVNDTIVLDSDSLPGSPDLFYTAEGNNTSLWALYNETIEERDLDNQKIKQKWRLPVKQNQTRYRFVPLKEEHKILLTNGEQLLLIHNHLAKRSTKSFFDSQESELQYSKFNNLQFGNTESLLKPNRTIAHSLVFSELKPIIEHILMDLSQRLNQQINITQLSIPESDLFDEYLLPDFLKVMEELKNQNIFDAETLNINFNNIMVPENPSQVLAAHVVQITWSVVQELEKINLYFKSNKSDDHPLCSCISRSLGVLINDVLLLANEGNNSKETKLSNVIQRIREFEKDLNNFLNAYASYYDTEFVVEVEDFETENLQESATNREFNLVYQHENDVLFIKNSFLPGHNQGEILPLVAGSVSNPHHLWAVTNTNATLTGIYNPGIYIYLQSINGQLQQIIKSAIQPRCLQQLRIKQETLLVFVQGCCQVQILKYRGSQGFITFAEINRNETIKQILTISVPSHQGNFKYFLLLLLERNIKFYEFILECYDLMSAPIPLDCL